MTSTQYWTKLKLPFELDDLDMRQLAALRRLVQNAFNEGKKHAAG